MVNPTVNKEFVARHLDMWIGQYFTDKKDLQNYTLGEWLAEYLPKIGNTSVLEWLANGGNSA